MSGNPDKKYEGFLKTRKILIVDESKPTASNVTRAIVQLGASHSLVESVRTFGEAKEQIEQKKPHILIAEVKLGDQWGIDLLNFHKAYYSIADRMFVLMGRSVDETLVAEAAEAEIDTYLLKPMTAASISSGLIEAFEKKAKPTEYLKLIFQAQGLLQDRKIAEAKEILLNAKKVEKAPVGACCLLGEVEVLGENYSGAIALFEEGLSIDPAHFKCLVGKFDCLKKIKQLKDAYEILQTIKEKHVLSARLIGQLFELAVYTRNYRDAEDYYKIFETLEHRPEGLPKQVIAAMVVKGRFHLNESEPDLALDAFKRALVTSSNAPGVIKRVVELLIASDQVKEAENLLNLLGSGQEAVKEVLELEILGASGQYDSAIQRAAKVIQGGQATPDLFSIVIRFQVKAGMEDKAMKTVEEAKAKFPESGPQFEELVSNK